ncbi:MAG TPA: hypothetical protein VLT90_09655, partial [Terriglobales bacterium]|nr:hypothetical protein [Terriglobales bacterium]
MVFHRFREFTRINQRGAVAHLHERDLTLGLRPGIWKGAQDRERLLVTLDRTVKIAGDLQQVSNLAVIAANFRVQFFLGARLRQLF